MLFNKKILKTKIIINIYKKYIYTFLIKKFLFIINIKIILKFFLKLINLISISFYI